MLNLLWFSVLAIGLATLLKSTDVFLSKAVDIFSYWRLSPFVIGALVVGIGTSLPELGVAISSAIRYDAALALGTVMGSNIANIMLILGISALLAPSLGEVKRHKVVGFLVVMTGLLGWFMMDLVLARWEGIILLILFVGFMAVELVKETEAKSDQALAVDSVSPRLRDFAWLVGALVCLLLSAEIIVLMAHTIASALAISESFIGLSIIAIGSSMPELTASVVAIRKGQVDLVYGNVLGSNIINTLLVVGVAVVISPILAVEANFLTQEIVVILGLSLGLLGAGLLGLWDKKRIRIFFGVAMVLGYGGYLAYAWLRML